jgi:hypothetical protein
MKRRYNKGSNGYLNEDMSKRYMSTTKNMAENIEKDVEKIQLFAIISVYEKCDCN